MEKSRSRQITASQDFQFLFDKMSELKTTHGELFISNLNDEEILPQSIDEIKRIVEACNKQEAFTTFTRV